MSDTALGAINDAKILAIIVAAIKSNAPAPMNMDIARIVGCADSTVTASLGRMSRTGRVSIARTGNSRVIRVEGVGATADVAAAEPRYEIARTLSPDDIETRRVENFSCHFCGARNCAKHGPARITTGRLFSHYSVGAQ